MGAKQKTGMQFLQRKTRLLEDWGFAVCACLPGEEQKGGVTIRQCQHQTDRPCSVYQDTQHKARSHQQPPAALQAQASISMPHIGGHKHIYRLVHRCLGLETDIHRKPGEGEGLG